MLSFRTKNKELLQNYLYIVLQSDDFFDYVTSTSKGTKMPRGDKDAILNYEFRLPSLDEQKRLSGNIINLEKKILLNKQINDNLLDLSFTLFNKKFPNMELGSNLIENYFLPHRGKNLVSKNVKSGSVPVVAGGLTPTLFHNEANTLSPVITISSSGANAGFVNLWTVPVWSSDSSFIDNSITDNIYFWFLVLKKRQREIFDMQTGSAQPHIYPKNIGNMKIKELSKDDVNNFNTLVTPLFEKYSNNILEIKGLIDIKNNLIKELI